MRTMIVVATLLLAIVIPASAQPSSDDLAVLRAKAKELAAALDSAQARDAGTSAVQVVPVKSEHPNLDAIAAAAVPIFGTIITALIGWAATAIQKHANSSRLTAEASMGQSLASMAARIAPELLDQIARSGVSLSGLTTELIATNRNTRDFVAEIKAKYPEFTDQLNVGLDTIAGMLAREARKRLPDPVAEPVVVSVAPQPPQVVPARPTTPQVAPAVPATDNERWDKPIPIQT